MSAKNGKGNGRKKAGRPSVKLDERVVEELASIDCSYQEMATILGVNARTLTRNYAQVIEKGRDHGKASLKRTQFKVAMGSPAVYDEDGNKLESETSPNPTMLIWLGKIRLGQREVQVHVNVSGMDSDDLRRIVAGDDPAMVLADRARAANLKVV